MLKIGMLGFGFMGAIHYEVYQQIEDAEVTGIFDMDVEKIEKGELTTGNIGEGGGEIDLTRVKLTEEPEELIESEDVDIIDICLPTFVHADYAIKAMEAGKDVFCEKPMALTPDECDQMIQARNKYGRKLMIGQCIRFWPEYDYARQMIRDRTYGDVVSAFFRRLSPVPTWAYNNWILQGEKSGGALLDLHIHDADYILHAFGDVEKVSSCGVQNELDANSGVDYVVTQYETSTSALIMAEGGWHFHGEFPFNMSFHIRFENASMTFDAAGENTLEIYTSDGKSYAPDMPGTTGWDEELKYFVECVKENKNIEVSPPEASREAVNLVLKENQSVLKGEPVKVT